MSGLKFDANTWLFRVASSPDMGAGHMSRCIHLARAFSHDHKIHFILDQPDKVWENKLYDFGFSCSVNDDSDIKNVLGCVLDGYQFTEEERKCWRKCALTLIEFDDHDGLSDLADFVIQPEGFNQPNTHASTKLTGFQYALIDPEYASRFSVIKSEVENILVTFGCVDKNNLTNMALDALKILVSQSCLKANITVAINSRAKHFEAVQSKMFQLGEQFRLLVDADNLKKQVFESDLIIGAGGVSLLERMAAGVPSIAVIANNNQCARVKRASEQCAVINVGETEGLSVEKLSVAILQLSDNLELRKRMSLQSRELVDGKGAERISNLVPSNKEKVMNL